MRRLTVLVQALLVGASFAAPASVDDEELKRDLTAVIALHGLPCGQVVAVTGQAENDFAASCEDGNNYRVYLNAAGRVVVEKQK
jgi:hypothetical protein